MYDSTLDELIKMQQYKEKEESTSMSPDNTPLSSTWNQGKSK